MSAARRNFTLLELVLSAMIMGIIAVLAGGLLFSVRETFIRINANSQTIAAELRLRRLCDGAIRNMIPFSWPDVDGRMRSIFKGEPDSVWFAFRSGVYDPQGGIWFARLALEDGSLVAYSRNLPLPNWLAPDCLTWSGVRREVIADKVEHLELRYAARKGNEISWTGAWESPAFYGTPAAVFLYLRFEDGSERRYLRRTSGNSYFSTLGSCDYDNSRE